MNKMNQSVLKNLSGSNGKNCFLGEFTNVLNIFSKYFSKLFTLKII